MSADRARRAEEWLGWRPVPDPPRHFRRRLGAAGDALADYVLSGDLSAARRLAKVLDGVVRDRRFPASTTGFRVALLNRAGIAHNWRGVRTSDVTELAQARRLLTAGLDLVADAGPDQARLDYNLGNTLLNLYQVDARPVLLADAVRHARRAVAHAGDDRRLAALARMGLASALRIDFQTGGDPDVLAEAVDHAEWTVRFAGDTPFGHRFRYVLADVLSVRYDVHGGLADLNRAIQLLGEAARTPDPTMAPGAREPFSATAGTLLRRRYLRTRDWADIDEAVRLLSDALGDGSDAKPAMLTNLGNALLTRYDDFGDEEDLLAAADLQQRAVASSKPGDWQLASRHNNAGNAFKAAWRVTGEAGFGELAIGHYRDALGLTPENAPERASREYNLAGALHRRYVWDGDETVLAEAVTAFHDAVRHGMNGSLEWALSAARQWGAWAVARESWDEACTAYSSALEAAARLFRIQLLRAEKEAWLAESQGLPAEAAYALFRAGRTEDAVVALEAGQSLLLSEVLERDRADLDRLAGTEHAALVARFRAATTALDEAMRGGAEPAVLRERRDEVDRAVDAIRTVAGFERFLRPPEIADVRGAVPAGAVLVYVAAAERAGVALAVGPHGRIDAVELPAASAPEVRRRVDALFAARADLAERPGRWEGTLDAATRWAWQAIVSSVRSMTANAERTVLVPSGMLAMLPLHAAWTPAADTPGGRRHLLDETVVTYAPTARSLDVTARTAARTPADRVAVVVDPRPATREPIGYGDAESAWVRRSFPAGEVLSGTAATRTAVVAAMRRASVCHFICHGLARADSPLDSALILAGDEELTLREILALRSGPAGVSPEARLAVLSACDTHVPGVALPDEVISLPSGLMQAGFAGVVATQWPIRGEAVSLLMARFYQLWQADGHDPASALRQAQNWLRDTTNLEKVEDLSAVLASSPVADDVASLVRELRLREPGERPYRHPSDWAALSYHGF